MRTSPSIVPDALSRDVYLVLIDVYLVLIDVYLVLNDFAGAFGGLARDRRGQHRPPHADPLSARVSIRHRSGSSPSTRPRAGRAT